MEVPFWKFLFVFIYFINIIYDLPFSPGLKEDYTEQIKYNQQERDIH